jgi:hypothetical protein
LFFPINCSLFITYAMIRYYIAWTLHRVAKYNKNYKQNLVTYVVMRIFPAHGEFRQLLPHTSFYRSVCYYKNFSFHWKSPPPSPVAVSLSMRAPRQLPGYYTFLQIFFFMTQQSTIGPWPPILQVSRYSLSVPCPTS